MVKCFIYKIKIDSPDSDKTLEDAEESRLKMRNKMIQLDYGKLNALYEIFIPQNEPSVEQTYFSFPSTSESNKNQDLLITISELENTLKTVNKGKNVNTKFDKSEASGTLLYVTPLPKNIAIKAKKMSNSKVNVDSLESFNSVRRQKSKDTKLKNRVLKNINAKSSTAHVRKMSRSVSIDSNKCETMNFLLHVLLSQQCQRIEAVLDGVVDCFFYKIPLCTLNVNVSKSSIYINIQNLLKIRMLVWGKQIQKLRQKESIKKAF
ncbi:hypothetical protein Tco_1094776 [Tanacetum coccineum]|uniref:Uncharacterized protein n=1 Tax=Tanacetum coccineum TaxID=301880 RepID=A0ABQ5IGG6_9ASTR